LALLPGAAALVSAETGTVSVEVEFAERIEVTAVTTSHWESVDPKTAPAEGAIIVPAVPEDGSRVAAFRVRMTPRRLLTLRVDAVSTTGQLTEIRCSYGAMPVTSCDTGFDLISAADAEFRIAAADRRVPMRASVDVTIAHQ
jgi:hypothetical protein